MLSKMTVGFGLSTAVISVATALLLIFKETAPPFKAWMAALTTHHWVTHGVFVVVGFIVLGFAFSQTDLQKKFDGDNLSNYIIGSVILSFLLTYGFYSTHL